MTGPAEREARLEARGLVRRFAAASVHGIDLDVAPGGCMPSWA